MKPQLLNITKFPNQSFSVRHDLKPSMNNKLHYHPEVELIYFVSGKGTQFIGDHISEFQPGDLVVVGPNLPHYWRFDANVIQEAGGGANVKVAHFKEDLFGAYFLNLPENRRLKEVLQKASRGIRIRIGLESKLSSIIDEMLQSEGTDRIICLMQALLEISRCAHIEILTSEGYLQMPEETHNDRIRNVYAYTYANYKKKIQLEDIAAVARISPTSFCRYFKSLTQKTYSQFLTEIKVGKACKLLINNSLDIKQVCYESGFNNFASFHKSFKKITGKSPLTYQKQFMYVR